MITPRDARVLVVMPGHLATSPRLLKAADAFADAGHDVRVVSGSFTQWAADADNATAKERSWKWQPVEYRPAADASAYRRSGLRRRIARAIVRGLGAARAPWWAVTRSLSRIHDELVRQALTEPFDVVVGGSVGGLAVVPQIASAARVPFGLDLEDLHIAESEAADATLQHALAARVLRTVLPQAHFLTTSTELMADAYHEHFGVQPTVIHNVVVLPSSFTSPLRRDGPLQLYWFSQTIGPGRGLEDAICAVGLAAIDAVLTLRGRPHGNYPETLQSLAATAAPRLRIVLEPPAAPDRMMDLCEGYDIGLSGEAPTVPNRRICLGNKIFTYLAQGLPVVLTDTPAHRWLAEQLGPAAVLYPSGDAAALGRKLGALSANPEALQQASASARRAACERWRWDHGTERDALVGLLNKAVG